MYLMRHTPLRMAVHIAFEKSADCFFKRVVKTFAGPYVHVEIIVSPKDAAHIAYTAYMSETFSRTLQKDFRYSDEEHDYLSIPVSDDELYRIGVACEACVESKIPYNLADMAMCQLPLRHPTDTSLYECKALFCSQALALLLRTCLDPHHRLQPYLTGINSRTITPSQLYQALAPHCIPKTTTQVLKL